MVARLVITQRVEKVGCARLGPAPRDVRVSKHVEYHDNTAAFRPAEQSVERD